MVFLRRFWEAWKRFGHFMGDLVGRVVLTLFYFTIFVPFGLGTRLFGDPLAIKEAAKTPQWLKRETKDLTLEDARRQA
jgi:hypothetical protein